MIILEFRLAGKSRQFNAIDEVIRTTQFIRNKCVRYWQDTRGIKPYDLNKYCASLAQEYEFVRKLNSMARQAAAERAGAAITRFYKNCRQKKSGKKGYPRFQKDCRSVEYKTSGWKLDEMRWHLTLTDGLEAGTFKLKGTRTLLGYALGAIKRVRLLRRADGYYAQFAIDADRHVTVKPSGTAIGIDLGLTQFYNAAVTILSKGWPCLHMLPWGITESHVWGETSITVVGDCGVQARSLNQESQVL